MGTQSRQIATRTRGNFDAWSRVLWCLVLRSRLHKHRDGLHGGRHQHYLDHHRIRLGMVGLADRLTAHVHSHRLGLRRPYFQP